MEVLKRKFSYEIFFPRLFMNKREKNLIIEFLFALNIKEKSFE